MYISSSRRQDRRNHIAQEHNAQERFKESKYDRLKQVLIQYGVKESNIPVLMQIIENILGIKLG